MNPDFLTFVKSLGFNNAEIIDKAQIVCEKELRKYCVCNTCGVYGKCWMCPPDIGDIELLISKVGEYDKGILYQSIFDLEDSFDFEGMQEGGRIHAERSRILHEKFLDINISDFLHLGKGGCGLCTPCAKAEDKPCRFPEKALSSLEAYGINVSATVKSTSMKYINGANTVTYFGLILFKENY